MVISGIIRPPPEIRAVADRTAEYVAKNGRTFEARIMKSEKGKTPKFSFLHETSPFHAYYEDRVNFFANGGETKEEAPKESDGDKTVSKETSNDSNKEKVNTASVPRKKEKTQKASVLDPIAKALLFERKRITDAKKRMETEKEVNKTEDDPQIDLAQVKSEASMVGIPLPPPTPLEFVSIAAPFTLSQTQIETIQLVAQFTAMDGKGGPFLHQLTLREWSNPEFSFCQPRHPHFAYFSALVDAYRKILREWTQAADSSLQTLTTLEQKTGKEKDPSMSCGPETVLKEAAYRAEYERELQLQMTKQEQEEGEVIAIDWNDFVVVETIEFPADEVIESSMLPPPPSSNPFGEAAQQIDQRTSARTFAVRSTHNADGMEESDDDDDGENIRVVPSYTPKVVGAQDPSSTRAIDPITGKSVAVADMPEHLRIQLLDPKWAEERKKFQEKQKDSNLVAGDAIVENISRLAQAREGVASKPFLAGANMPQLTEAKRKAGTDSMDQAIFFSDTTRSEPSEKKPRLHPGAIQDLSFTVAQAPAELPKTEADVEVVESSEPAEERKLLSEEDFVASLSSPEVTLQIRIPNDITQMAWNFYGQIALLKVDVMKSVKDVKAELSKSHLNDMPANKIVLKDPNGGFLSNNATLASLNIGPVATLELREKQRGGRK